jgi:hypothetical protein
MVRQSDQQAHAACLPNRDCRLHAVHRHRPAGGISQVTRAHVIEWRDDPVRRELGGSTVCHRIAALAALFEYLCGKNAVTQDPVKGMVRPKTESGKGGSLTTPGKALSHRGPVICFDVSEHRVSRDFADGRDHRGTKGGHGALVNLRQMNDTATTHRD